MFHRQPDMMAPPELKKIHPLGKSPLISIEGPGLDKPLVIAESGFMTEYLVDYFGPHLKPTEWLPGQENTLAGHTPEWMRYRYYMHYAEGSLMTPLVLLLVTGRK